jgi:hypothetical protein
VSFLFIAGIVLALYSLLTLVAIIVSIIYLRQPNWRYGLHLASLVIMWIIYGVGGFLAFFTWGLVGTVNSLSETLMRIG